VQAGLTVVLLKHPVERPVVAVLDGPVQPHQAQQVRKAQVRGGQGGDEVAPLEALRAVVPGALLGRPLSAALPGTSAPALTLNMASICLYAYATPNHSLLMSFPSPVWSFFGPKNRIWSRKCERRPRSQRAAP
jgi:hypothetical protein